jgi:hypothetical protein
MHEDSTNRYEYIDGEVYLLTKYLPKQACFEVRISNFECCYTDIC